MKKWPRRLLVGSVMVLLGVYPLLAPPAHRIDQEHFELIKTGMTLDEVESIFGQPAGDYDWAVANDSDIGVWDAVTGRKINLQGGVTGVAFSSDGKLLATTALVSRTRVVQLVLWDSVVRMHSRVWTSRHGSGTVSFDENLRVTATSDWRTSRLEPPWSHWWKKIFGE